MSVDPTGPVAPKPSVNAPRAGSGPKRPPRPERASTPDTRTNGNGRSAAPPGFASPVSDTAVIDAPVADHVAPAPPAVVPTPAPTTATVAPAAIAGAPEKRRRRGRRVKRVLRRIDLWSVLKLALVVYTCIYLSVLATLAALWGLLYSSGSIEKLQSFLEDVGLENFTFYGNQMFRACAAIGAVGVIAGTVITVLSTALVNVISELTGGIRLVVIEEDVDG